MRGFLIVTTVLAAIGAFVAPAVADTMDPLHLSCSTCGGDNGTFTPILNGQAAVGVQVDETGTVGGFTATDFILKVLIPNSVSINTEAFAGTLGASPFSGAASLFTSAIQGTQWTSGSLEANFLGIATGNGAPPNPIGAFLPSTQALAPTATGFFVLTLDLGSLFVEEQNKGASPFLLSTLAALPAGTWILGDACTSGTVAGGDCVDITTAQSAALFAQPLVATPLPAAAWLFGGGLAFFGLLKRMVARRRQQGPVSMFA